MDEHSTSGMDVHQACVQDTLGMESKMQSGSWDEALLGDKGKKQVAMAIPLRTLVEPNANGSDALTASQWGTLPLE
ncbi:hypothetical protein P7K49_014945 [Saguinus oedipus]|uniref:Uncharacterized protein n=1 Tax=Saguinus oedipus TaxID=9490 RepID=A0ABQ9V7U6_SAGOE|nr:hypothetical protein P7K49_014945 [Saguinus oedipus]